MKRKDRVRGDEGCWRKEREEKKRLGRMDRDKQCWGKRRKGEETIEKGGKDTIEARDGREEKGEKKEMNNKEKVDGDEG